jgi:hypothetical protein
MTVRASKDWIQQLYVQETTKKSPEPDFYKDKDGNIVMTESYHINRGSCCGSRCLTHWSALDKSRVISKLLIW